MKPPEIGQRYDRIAQRWLTETSSVYGMSALERAIRLTTLRGRALDVGCGSTGRFLAHFKSQGFAPEGLDVSAEMIRHSREQHPFATYFQADIGEWTPPHSYSLITAWDSTFHLPQASQAPVMEKLAGALEPGGVLLFTCGGGEAGEISGSFWGEDFDYSTLGVEAFVRLLHQAGCFCRHVEYDQWPENHVAIIAQKMPDGSPTN